MYIIPKWKISSFQILYGHTLNLVRSGQVYLFFYYFHFFIFIFRKGSTKTLKDFLEVSSIWNYSHGSEIWSSQVRLNLYMQFSFFFQNDAISKWKFCSFQTWSHHSLSLVWSDQIRSIDFLFHFISLFLRCNNKALKDFFRNKF
jgi:hypothetical protein